MDRKKNIPIVLFIVIVGLCLVCSVPPVYSLNQRRQALRADVAALENIARSLGYRDREPIYLVRYFEWSGIDSLKIAFWTPLSYEEVVARLLEFGYLSSEDVLTPVENPNFLEEKVNSYNEGDLVTYNGHYKPEDFNHDSVRAPSMRGWSVKRKDIEILHFTCGGLTLPDDRWVINNQSLSGSIVQITYKRAYQSATMFTLDFENNGIVKDIDHIKRFTPSVTPTP